MVHNDHILLALMVTSDGLPVDYEIFSGDTYEGHTLIPALTKIRKRYHIDKIVFVADSAMLSQENIAELEERSINMARIFNHREGFTSKDDTLPEVFYHNFKGGPLDGQGAINKKDFKKAIKLRYELMGWNPDTGIPTSAKLLELDLDWLIDEVKP